MSDEKLVMIKNVPAKTVVDIPNFGVGEVEVTNSGLRVVTLDVDGEKLRVGFVDNQKVKVKK